MSEPAVLEPPSQSSTPTSPDWTLIQSLYLAGKTPKEISLELGVKAQAVSVRASRYGWTASLAKAKQLVRVTKDEDSDTQEVGLKSASESTRNSLARVLERSVERIEAMSIPNAKTALKVNAALEPLVRNAKTVFGWNDGEQQSIVRIGVMNTCVVASPSLNNPNPVPQEKVIDVTTVNSPPLEAAGELTKELRDSLIVEQESVKQDTYTSFDPGL